MNRHIPTQPRAQATRRAILDAAYAMLGELEPDEISTVAVAGRAGVPVGSVYRYYANRTDIFRALAEQAMELVDTPFEDMLLSGASIELMVENAIGLLLANNTVADMRLLRLIRLSPDLVDVWTTSNRRVEAALAAAIQARGGGRGPTAAGAAGRRVVPRAARRRGRARRSSTSRTARTACSRSR